MAIKLDYFTYDMIEQYYLENFSENDFWLFAAYYDPDDRTPPRNTEKSSREFLEKTIFALKYSMNDFAFMAPMQLWRSNTVFTQYDDNEVLEGTQFFVVVEPENEAGDYHIFKCISNNNGSISQEPPIYNPSFTDGLYFLSDGYVWKYMSSTPYNIYRKFFARGLLPVLRNQDVENNSFEGIFNIAVENRLENNGYQRITGNIDFVNTQGGISTVFLENTFSRTLQTTPIFDIPNAYSNRTLYVEKANPGMGLGGIELEILESGVTTTGSRKFVTVSTPSNFILSSSDKIEILPRISIRGDGHGASAIPIFNDDNTQIDSIRMLSFGDNYRSAEAEIIDPFGFDETNPNRQDIRCIIRPIISPLGGHGFNILSELKVKHLGLSKNISGEAPSLIPNTGFYGKVGVVKNPTFNPGNYSEDTFDNRIKVEMNTLPSVQPGDKVFQNDKSAIVHEVDEFSNTLYLIEYDGPYDGIITDSEPLEYQNTNFDINSIEYSPYEGRTGKPLSIINITPTERSEEQSEQMKIILDF